MNNSAAKVFHQFFFLLIFLCLVYLSNKLNLLVLVDPLKFLYEMYELNWTSIIEWKPVMTIFVLIDDKF